MNFPNVITPPCENPYANAACPPNLDQTGGIDTGEIDVPSTDPRCSDPAFAALNPTLCKSFPVLILKPEAAVTEPGKNVTYKAYLQTGAIEVPVTMGLTWSISDDSIAIINQSGIATGVWAGVCTVSVQWETDFFAHARLEVVAACLDVTTCYLLLLDNSPSSAQNFSAQYGTKLSYAKAVATHFIDMLDTSRDTFAVGEFNDTTVTNITLEQSTDKVAGKAAVNAITTVPAGKTNISDAIEIGFDYLTTALSDGDPDTVDRKGVLILITDFEHNTPGGTPPELAKYQKDAGNTIVVVAERCWGLFFQMAYQTASGGYFLSAHVATAAAVLTTLPGLKSFMCGGSCQPDAGTFPTAMLDYTGFIHWNVISGKVDLVGLDKWNVCPDGQGLYVDMFGTDAENPSHSATRGIMQSKVAFPVENGKEYRFSLKVAGTNRSYAPQGAYAIQVTVGDYVDEKIEISNTNKGFSDAPSPYEYEFTATADETVYLGIEALNQPVGKGVQVGLLVDEIEFKCLTDDDVLLYDDFDAENLTTILPGPNYYGCLLLPPAAQTADPTPPPTLNEN